MELSDRVKYKKSLADLTDQLNRSVSSSSTDIVIALSRKGPRLLEFLKRNFHLKPMNVVTEHALPFLFDKINNDKENKYRLFIVDDAIYFGSSILGLKEEIDIYISAYGLNNRVEIVGIYSCIKDKESMDFSSIPVYSTSDIRTGYGHFFVKNVMKDLQSLGKSLEVEFPAVKYTLDQTVDSESLKQQLVFAFGKNKVYSIDRCEGIESISVILSDVQESTFRKFRVFLQGNTITVVTIAPELVTTNFDMFKYVVFGSNEQVNRAWKNVIEKMTDVSKYLEGKAVSTRNLMRTAVVLLNYFSSLDTFCYYRKEFEDAIGNIHAGHLLQKTIDCGNLLNILGEGDDVTSIISAWSEAIADIAYKTNPNIDTEKGRKQSIAFELPVLADLEAGRLERTNLTQLLNCKMMEEALSAMFFNQTLMIERWSRGLNLNRQERLRFGYTFSYIWQFIWDNANGLNTDQLSQTIMHHWVDVQIDNGSIVPQYIIDHASQQWIRVFRPGENEDFTISHLGRLVVHVIQKMALDISDNAIVVNRRNLQGILAVIYDKMADQLNEEECNNKLSIDRSHKLYYRSDDLIDVLIRMFILTETPDGNISLHARICNNEFSRNTTLGQDLVLKIDKLVKNILEEAGSDGNNVHLVYSNTINYFLSNLITIENIKRDLRDVGDFMGNAIRSLIKLHDQINDSRMLVANGKREYEENLSCYEMNYHVLQDADRYELSVELLPYLWKVRQIVHLENILIILYFADKETMNSYISMLENEGFVHELNTCELLDSLKVSQAFHENVGKDKVILLKLLGYLNNVILNF